jgi:hypothetical protein
MLFFVCTAASSHPGIATCVKNQKDVVLQEGQLTSRKYPRCHAITNSPPTPQRRIFARNFFNKIDAETSYLGYTSVQNQLPLSCDCEIKYAAYIVNLHYICCVGGGKLPQLASLHSRGNIYMEGCDQEQEQSRPLQHTADSKSFVIFPPKILLHLVCIITSSLQTEFAIRD